LKKVEELTLYLIEKDKQLHDQQILLEQQQKINKSVNKQLKYLKLHAAQVK